MRRRLRKAGGPASALKHSHWKRGVVVCFRVAMLSLHTSPLALLGRTRDAGGMNVYVRELSRELGRGSMYVDNFTRRSDPSLPPIQHVSERTRLIHIPAGPAIPLPPSELPPYVDDFARRVARFAERSEHGYDMLHSHYWLSGAATLLCVGRLDPIKGIDLVLESVAAMHVPARLIVVGGNPDGDPEVERLRAVAADLGLADRVTFPGAVAQRDLPRYYRGADALVVTSRYESFGLAAVEALACGTPVVAGQGRGLASIGCEGGDRLPARWPRPRC